MMNALFWRQAKRYLLGLPVV
uniref:Uncharacterized protein n=1 Tax=Ralstonia solanacearum TaxID=305 RepID=A0A0S4VE01_RALSL|nr:protein of unknown function [Ralstonia solanacearum]